MVSTLPENTATTTTTTTTTNTTTQSTTDDGTSQNFIGRVMGYPSVNTLVDTAKGAYSYAKEYPMIKKGLESVEQGIDSTMKNIVNPVLENETIKKTTEQLDALGCKQLDKMEKLQPTVNMVMEKVNEMAETTVHAVQPVDQYLKNSYLAAPLNAAVNYTENLVDKYIPEKKESTEKKEETESQTTEEVTPGPIFKSGAIAMKLQQEALSKLSNLKIRDQIQIESYQYIVNLIDYASKNFDQTKEYVKSSKQSVESSVNNGIEVMKCQAPHLKENTMKNVQHLTNDALNAVKNAIELISSKLPENVSQTTSKVLHNIQGIPIVIEEANAGLYAQVSSKSAEKLKELGTKINQTLELSGTLPVTLLQHTQEALYNIYSSFYKEKDYSSSTTPTASSE